MASSANHNGSCAHATGHHCACTGCGGSRHGWEGWVELVAAETAREARASAFEKEVRRRAAKRKPTERTSLTRMTLKAVVTDLARLDLTRWLSTQRRGAAAGTPIPSSDGPIVFDDDRDGGPARAVPPPAGAESDATRSGTGSRPDPTEQTKMLAQCMAESTWDDIAAEIAASTRDAATVRRQLADHFWCDLFVAFARAVDDLQQGLQEIPDTAKELIKRSVHGSSMQSARSALSAHIIDFTVERVWTALRTAPFGGVPLLTVLTGDELLRGLRILAVFICPAPEKHSEVRVHAVKPLAGDVRQYLTEETKDRLAGSFADLR